MRKFLYIMCTIFMLLLANNSFAMETKDALGVWKGDLANLTNVTLNLSKENAAISFIDHHGSNLNYGMLDCTYQKNTDDTVAVYLHRKSDGVLINLNAKLVKPNELIVYNFWYEDDKKIGSSAGTLHK